MGRAILLVADSFGVGAAPDADKFGDVGANTLGHIAEHYELRHDKLLALPHLSAMGLAACAHAVSNDNFSLAGETPVSGAFGAAAELSSGKDTPSGHWEMTGVPVLFEWGYYPDQPNCFPQTMLDALISDTGVSGVLGCRHASGTEIIEELGEQHLRSGKPICYTSGDSVFQVAAHEETFGLDRLYAFCEAARDLLYDDNIGRVIARPFVGKDAKSFIRTGNRRDYSVEPPADTLLDVMTQQKLKVASIGKIADIFAHRGITSSTKATGLEALLDETVKHIQTQQDGTLIFTNLVNFDQDFGHRRNPAGYAEALQYFDRRLPEITRAMQDDDLLIITADHGCDPTWPGSDHTREYVPVLAWRPGLGAVDLGQRDTFADIGQTLAEFFNLPPLDYGTSFYGAIA